MVKGEKAGLGPLLAAGVLGGVGYGLLAWRAEIPEARGWLAAALVLGWAGLAAAWKWTADSRAARIGVVGFAVVFRVMGLGVMPTWEDDYHRYLWDGYVSVTTGDPYAEAPAAAFGRGGEIPVAVEAALDGINNPDLPTIYGPVSQAVFAVGAWIAPGNFTLLKLLLFAAELAGWWCLRRRVGWGGWLLLCWCPLAVTEFAFAGHPEALGVAASAWAIAAWLSGSRWATAAAVALATAVKPFGAALAPFVARRWGWRSALAVVGIWAICYLPFWLQGSAGEWAALRMMSRSFEYNSTGFAVLAWALPDHVARPVAMLITLALVAGWGTRWLRGGEEALPPVAAMLGCALLMAPVVNPWYALWLLPWLAVRPHAWGVGVLLAVPLAYTHGWTAAMGAGVDYTHPWWTRPLEIAVVLAAVAVARWRRI